jgi:hypothetical protein
MSVLHAGRQLIAVASTSTADDDWQRATDAFDRALADCDDPDALLALLDEDATDDLRAGWMISSGAHPGNSSTPEPRYVQGSAHVLQYADKRRAPYGSGGRSLLRGVPLRATEWLHWKIAL